MCENHYCFQGQFCAAQVVRHTLKRADLGPCIGLLTGYLRALSDAGRLSESIFCDWGAGWAERRGQPDVNRLGADLAKNMVVDYQLQFTDPERERLESLARCGASCPADTLLDAMGMIRNKFYKDGKPDEQFLRKYQPHVFDLLRRFVTATTKRSLRFGLIDGDGRGTKLWARDRVERVELENVPSDASGRWYVFVGKDHHPLFPIGDLIRMDPADASVWAYYNTGEWVDLTKAATARRHCAPGPDHPLLPDQQEFESCEVWRSTNAK
jgi:hypothetical protein